MEVKSFSEHTLKAVEKALFLRLDHLNNLVKDRDSDDPIYVNYFEERLSLRVFIRDFRDSCSGF